MMELYVKQNLVQQWPLSKINSRLILKGKLKFYLGIHPTRGSWIFYSKCNLIVSLDSQESSSPPIPIPLRFSGCYNYHFVSRKNVFHQFSFIFVWKYFSLPPRFFLPEYIFPDSIIRNFLQKLQSPSSLAFSSFEFSFVNGIPLWYGI